MKQDEVRDKIMKKICEHYDCSDAQGNQHPKCKFDRCPTEGLPEDILAIPELKEGLKRLKTEKVL